jgi:hypothetical protein
MEHNPRIHRELIPSSLVRDCILREPFHRRAAYLILIPMAAGAFLGALGEVLDIGPARHAFNLGSVGGLAAVLWWRLRVRMVVKWLPIIAAERGLCPACGYPLAVGPLPACSECGTDLQSAEYVAPLRHST